VVTRVCVSVCVCVCLCVCLSAAACPHYCTDPDVTWGSGIGMPHSCALLSGFAIGAHVALLWQHYRNAWQSPAVILQVHRTSHACRTPHTLRMPAKTPLAGDKIDAPAACAVPFRPYCGGVVTRTRNVSEYMLVLALCLVTSTELEKVVYSMPRTRRCKAVIKVKGYPRRYT